MNFTPRSFAAASVAAATVSCLLLSGCHVVSNENGDKKNVDISTPFGGMKVNTDNSTDTTAIGITAYPGAVPVKDDHDSNENNANINMSFGDFHLGVRAAGFQTTDQPDKVLDFYRKDLAKRYGDVLECRGNKTVGSLAHTSQGLTCDDDGHSNSMSGDVKGIHFHGNGDSSDNIELRAGSEQHRHIVGVEPRNGGTKIGLVALDLPSHLGNHDKKSEE